MGYEYEEHSEAKHLYGYEGKQRAQKAHIIVRRKHVGSAANDVGFLKKSNGKYEMIISEYDRASGSQSINFMQKLHMTYNKHKVMKEVKKYGFNTVTSQKTDKDGRLKIRIIGP